MAARAPGRLFTQRNVAASLAVASGCTDGTGQSDPSTRVAPTTPDPIGDRPQRKARADTDSCKDGHRRAARTQLGRACADNHVKSIGRHLPCRGPVTSCDRGRPTAPFLSGRAPDRRFADRFPTRAAAGGRRSQLTRFDDRTIIDFDWSPDGSRLVVARPDSRPTTLWC